jgi:hypothetical protein
MSFTAHELRYIHGLNFAVDWDVLLSNAASTINRSLTYDEACQILGRPFINTMNLDDAIHVWVVMHRLLD